MLDPFGRIKQTCEQCGWTVPSVLNAKDQGPIVTEDNVRITDRVTDFCCPVCRDDHQLHVAMLINTQVVCCRQCQGFLVDSESFGALIQSLRAAYAGADDQPVMIDNAALKITIQCPACQQTMFTHPYYGAGNAVINSCSRCNLNWFDAGELSSLIRAPGIR